jgi:hypothetical protein
LAVVGWCPDGAGFGRERGGGKLNRRRRHGGCGFLEEESLRQGNGGSWESPGISVSWESRGVSSGVISR